MKVYATNRRAKFDYHILKTLEAGIELNGHEVKSVRSGRLNLSGSYAIVQGNEIRLLNAEISSFQPSNTPPDFQPDRSRRLLFAKKEIGELIGKLKDRSFNLIPLKAYGRGSWIKLEIGLAKKKKGFDKREKIKREEAKKEIKRTLFRRQK